VFGHYLHAKLKDFEDKLHAITVCIYLLGVHFLYSLVQRNVYSH